MLSLLFAPLCRLFEKVRIPCRANALLIIAALLSLIAGTGYGLSDQASDWLAKAPQALRALQNKIRPSEGAAADLKKTSDALNEMVALDAGQKGRAPAPPPSLPKADIAGALFSGTAQTTVRVLVTLSLLYFLLASGDLFLEKLVKILPGMADKKRAVMIVRGIERQISQHFIVHFGIDLVFAASLGLSMWALGMPNPVMIAAVAALLHLVPYLGPVVNTAMLILIASLTFDETSRIGLVLLVYGTLLTLKAFISPAVMGRAHEVNPVVVVISVLWWGWMWGVAGAFLAVPLLISLRIARDQLPRAQRTSEFLSR